MMADTHKIIGGSSALVLGAAATLVTNAPDYLEVLAVALVAPTAAAASSIPDSAEKVLHLPHRKLTHYPSVQILMSALMAFAFIHYTSIPDLAVAMLAGGVAFGCLMHSIADAMTIDRRGIALLWPFTRRGFHLMPYRMRVRVGSGSRSERVFAVAWSVLMVGIVLSYIYARFRHQISA